MTALQQRRLRELRSRVLVRAFNYRQRHHAHGVWFRLRRLLALASEAYLIDAEDARRLIAEGQRPDPVGEELEPQRIVLVVPRERVAMLGSARRTAVRLSAEVLAAQCLALVPFDIQLGPRGAVSGAGGRGSRGPGGARRTRDR
ncbi:MAG: hypothetical protein AB2L07_09500 [Thermoanaerobaculaceae bacterium]